MPPFININKAPIVNLSAQNVNLLLLPKKVAKDVIRPFN